VPLESLLTQAGITTDEFDAACRARLAQAQHPRFRRPYPGTVYLDGRARRGVPPRRMMPEISCH